MNKWKKVIFISFICPLVVILSFYFSCSVTSIMYIFMSLKENWTCFLELNTMK